MQTSRSPGPHRDAPLPATELQFPIISRVTYVDGIGVDCWGHSPRPEAQKWPAPAGALPTGAVFFSFPTTHPRRRAFRNSAKGPISRILSCAVIPLGAALPRTLISDLPGGFGNCLSRLNASGRCAAPPGFWRKLPSLFGLAPCGVYPAPGFTAGAVRSYRTISPLPRHRGSKLLQGCPRPDPKKRGGVAEAVSFLWHWPSADFEVRVPDVIRHTALRSSDFPPPKRAEAHSGSDRPVLLPEFSLAQLRVYQLR